MISPDSPLVQVIARLLGQSRADGSVQRHVCGHGLHLRVSTGRGDTIALTRPNGQASMDEAQVVAEHAGWTFFKAHYVDTGPEHARIRYLVVQPDAPPPEHDPHTPPQQDDGGPPDAFIRALLEHPGPWRQEALTLRGDIGSYLAGARRCQLVDMHDWIKLKFPDQYREFRQQHPPPAT